MYTLFNSVQSLDVNVSLIRDTIVCRETCLCRDEGGILFSNNFIHGTDLLYLYLSMSFNSMIDHGFAPDSFLQSSNSSHSKRCKS